jgi:drug/metabolite transporter (DMT)-like permease
MIRTGATELILFLLPFMLYAVYLLATRSQVLHSDSWPLRHIAWLLGAALLLVIGSFIYFANYTGAPVGSDYEPAHMEDGKFVPQRIRR